jgi:hypothetical protein
MQLWKLSVVQPDSDDWRASTYKGKAIIRAPDKSSARRLAGIAFSIASKRIIGQPTPVDPWIQKDLVSCEPFESNEYDIDGSEAILYPSR